MLQSLQSYFERTLLLFFYFSFLFFLYFVKIFQNIVKLLTKKNKCFARKNCIQFWMQLFSLEAMVIINESPFRESLKNRLKIISETVLFECYGNDFWSWSNSCLMKKWCRIFCEDTLIKERFLSLNDYVWGLWR